MIRKANVKDQKAIYTMICSLENHVFDEQVFKERFEINLKDASIHYYVYEENEKVIAMGSLYIKKTLHHKSDTGEIVELYVNESHRSKGIGSQLLRFIEEEAKILNLCELEVSSNMKRVKAHAFYKQNYFILNHYNLVKEMN